MTFLTACDCNMGHGQIEGQYQSKYCKITLKNYKLIFITVNILVSSTNNNFEYEKLYQNNNYEIISHFCYCTQLLEVGLMLQTL